MTGPTREEFDALEARVAALEEQPAPEPEPDVDVSGMYTVRSGDTLSRIAALFRLSVDDLARWNELVDRNVIRVGQVLRLTSPDQEQDEPPEVEPDPEPEPDVDPELGTPPPMTAQATGDGRAALSWPPAAQEGVSYPIAEHLYQGKRVVVDRVDEPSSVRGPLAPGLYAYSYAVRLPDGRQSPDSALVEVRIEGTGSAPPVKPDTGDEPVPTGPVPVGPRPIYDGRFPRGWATAVNLQCLGYNGSPAGYRGDRARVGEFHGRQACRFVCGPNDRQAFSSKPRSELRLPAVANPAIGMERWYRIGFLLEEGSTVDSDWFIITQWHAGSGSPTLTLQIDRQMNLVLANNRDWSQNKKAFRVRPGQWHDVVLHTKFGASSGTGWAELWEGGQLVLPRHGRSNLLSGGSPYMKHGIYQGGGADAAVCIDGLVITGP